MRDKCFIGVLSDEAVDEMKKDADRAAKVLAKVKEERKDLTLQPDSFVKATLKEKKIVSHDTRSISVAFKSDLWY
jgi:nitrate reductase (NAD(P)H)